MGLESIPQAVRDRFHIEERGHASAILASDYPNEFTDLMECLGAFSLRRSHIMNPGGGRSQIPSTIDGFLRERGWREKSFDIAITVDGSPVPIPTHKIDNFKNEVGVEVEWNNKTEFYDRDLNNFRLLKELRVLAVGVIITRLSELRTLFTELGEWHKYGTTSTHWDKLIPKVDGGGAGGCPLLLVGIGAACYDPHS
jgi:hypothetical protein